MGSKETSIFNAVLITAVVLGTIIVYFIVSIIRQQRRNLELQRQNILAEINALEKERARIAADLHDDLGPLLSSIKFKINSVDAADEEDQFQLQKASTHIDDLITRMRQIAGNLMPNTLVRKGLVAALQQYIDQSAQNHTRIIFTSAPNLNINQEKSINIYRIVQEVVHNTLKHAKATELFINIAQENNTILLSTKDNGAGFDYHDKLKEEGGFGLRNLKSRAEILGGRLSVHSKPGKGTSYFFEIPVE